MDFGVKVAFKTLVHYSLFPLGFLVAISVAGIDLSKFAIMAGALGVGIGFGLQNIVNNFLSGLILLFERPVKVGDTVSIDDQWGTITKIGLRSTVVETLDRAELIVPNSDLISQKVTNWTFTSDVSRVVLPVGVAYGSTLDQVLEILSRWPMTTPTFSGSGTVGDLHRLRRQLHRLRTAGLDRRHQQPPQHSQRARPGHRQEVPRRRDRHPLPAARLAFAERCP